MKVYYNKSCNICRAEINLYKKQNIKEIEWVDVTRNKKAEIDTLKNEKDLLRRLHVEKNGKIHSGAKAFLIVWKEIPKYRIFYYIFKLPIIFNIFSAVYELVAYFLYLKNKNQLNN